jgi:transposase InsO family protein
MLRRSLESAQYLSIRYTERLLDADIEPSVGSVGDSYDNALAETINGLFKVEVIHGAVRKRSSSPPSNGSIGQQSSLARTDRKYPAC